MADSLSIQDFVTNVIWEAFIQIWGSSLVIR